MIFGQLIEYKKRNIFFKNCAENGARRLVPDLLLLFKKILGESKCSAAYFQYILIVLNLPYNKKQRVKLQTIDPEIFSISILQKEVWDQFLSYILCMIYQEKCFSCHILLTLQILLSDSLYFSRYWSIWLLRLLYKPGCDVIKFDINLIFLRIVFGVRP